MSEQSNEKNTPSSSSNTQFKDNGEKKEKTKVISSAIVKYVEDLKIIPYAKLRQDTDLNVAPSNWLRDGRFTNTFDQKRNPLNFSSFGIAHNFLENIGDVDIISDAENIKKLLKMAYSKTELSLVVHRIGNTLLLDDLDLTALLSYISGNHVDTSNLRWLYEFYCEQKGIPKDTFFKKKKNKHGAKQKNIFSKFLHYSVQQDASFSLTDEPSTSSNTPGSYSTLAEDLDDTPPKLPLVSNQPASTQTSEVQPDNGQSSPIVNRDAASGSVCTCEEEDVGKSVESSVFPQDVPFDVSPLGDDELEDDVLPEPQQMSSFQKVVLWKFEDLHMLVGSNLPIFGGGRYPAVSLRLRDCGKPINVLTGLDYWLDNLMCNVPEVAMCYHLDGIVQYYDLFKTEDLPQLDGSSFSPKVVKDIAQNVLSFMKSNCTQEGHTYWLYKASDSEVVKLYDLTSICDQKTEEKHENPFTIPVAMLFYRVAKNMMKQDTMDTSDQSIARLLLDNCVDLLDHHKFPEIVTSANLLLSSLYSPDNIHTLPSSADNDSANNSQEDLTTLHKNMDTPTDAMASKGSLEVRALSTPGMYQDDIRQVARKITNNTEERCKKALSHIVKGLRCLTLGLSTDQEAEEMDDVQSDSGKGAYSVRRIKTLDPNSTHTPTGRSTEDKEPLILVKPLHWRSQSKTLLLRKATSVYHSMACLSNTNGKYGRGLRYCKLSFQCLQAYKTCGIRGTLKYDEDFELIRSLNCTCADSYLMLAKCRESFEVHHDDFMNGSSDDAVIAKAASEFGDVAHGSKVEFKFDIQDNLMISAEFYEVALDLAGKNTKEDEFVSLARRVGNVKNELGVFYMNQAAAMIEQGVKLAKQRELWKKSFAFFESGIKAFESIDDRANVALLYSNSGRLMRLCAQAVGGRVGTDKPSMKEFSLEEKTFFKQSIEFYNRALQSLTERNVCAEVWDAVTWELSGAYFIMATLLQDYPPLSVLSQQEVEKEVTELMMKTLKICEPTGKGSVPNVRPHSSDDLDRRIGSTHHRLASLYHNAYRNEISDQSRKKARSLADLHYTKACLYYKAASFPCEWIRVHLERVAMCEHQLALHGSGTNASIKSLDAALDYILRCQEALVAFTDKKLSTKISNESEVKSGKRREMKSGNITEEESSEKGTSVMGEENTESIDNGRECALHQKSQGKDFTSNEVKDTRGDEGGSNEREIEELREKEQYNTVLETEREKIIEPADRETKQSVKDKHADGSTSSTESNIPGDQTCEEDKTNQNSEENNGEKEKDIKRTDKNEATQVKDTSVTFDERLFQELKVLLPILETRLNFVLKEMVKFRSTRKVTSKKKEVNAVELEKVKRMYSIALRGCAGDSQEDILNKVKRITEVLSHIHEIKVTA